MQYVVKSGDTLSEISQKFYGTPYQYNQIVAANSFIQNADRIEVGWILEIPGTELIGPPSANQPLMLPPGGSSAPVAPTPGVPSLPSITGPATSAADKQKQMLMLVLVIASLALGYFVMKNYAKKQESKAAPEPATAPNPSEDEDEEESE